MLTRVEQATLRPVPLRPAGPVHPADAFSHVLASLPEVDAEAARALALIEIAGRTRDQAGDEAGLTLAVLGEALYRARKALRRSIFPLSASGWCERAERLLSDRIDGVLQPPGPARLDVHLRNCERCVDHERRLSQAREKLVREFIDAYPDSAGAGPAERGGQAALRVVEPAAVVEPAEQEERYDGPTRTVPGFDGPALERIAGESEPLPFPSFAGPGGQVAIVVEPRKLQIVAPEPPAPEPPAQEPPAPAPEGEAGPVELAASVVWGALSAASVALAVFALIVTVLAIAGMDRIL
jgi:hypothetical protein